MGSDVNCTSFFNLRYELDMLLGWFEETIRLVEELCISFEDAPSNVFDGSLHIKKFFTGSCSLSFIGTLFDCLILQS